VKNKSGFLARAIFERKIFMSRDYYGATLITPEKAVKDKLNVLREFQVVDKNNEHDIKRIHENAIQAEPNKDFQIILDRVSHTLIMNKLNS
jgi:hypothetical protein